MPFVVAEAGGEKGAGGAAGGETCEVAGGAGLDLVGDEVPPIPKGFFNFNGGIDGSDEGNESVVGRKSNPGNIFFGPSPEKRNGDGLLFVVDEDGALAAAFLNATL